MKRPRPVRLFYAKAWRFQLWLFKPWIRLFGEPLGWREKWESKAEQEERQGRA